MKTALIVLGLAAASLAASPATRPHELAPTTPPVVRTIGQVVDARQPAFVPKFAQANNPPAGRFDERNYACRFTVPGPYFGGYGGYGYGFGYGGYGLGGFGFGGGSWGSTSVAFR